MELEFDKEIDALLRKARSGTSAAAGGTHLDADAVAAFVEGAVPEAVRKTYTAHLADCDSCRKALSHVALLKEPAALTAVAAAASAPMAAAPAQKATAPWPPNAVPWYRPLFRSPGLAAAFGVLVLAFGGVLVYFVTQSRSTNDSVAMQAERNANAAVPYAGTDSNAAANATFSNSSAAASANSAAANTTRSENAPANPAVIAGKSNNSPMATASGDVDGVATGSSSVAATAPPPVASAPQPSTVAGVAAEKPKDEPKAEDRREDKETARYRVSDDALARGADSTAKKVAGPTRGAGPVQNQMQMNTQATEMAVTRKVGGKTFHNSNGAWYDNSYHGQSTTDVRRGTEEFKKLDSGLRSIANELGGVVVVVWKNKAFRIQ